MKFLLYILGLCHNISWLINCWITLLSTYLYWSKLMYQLFICFRHVPNRDRFVRCRKLLQHQTQQSHILDLCSRSLIFFGSNDDMEIFSVLIYDFFDVFVGSEFKLVFVVLLRGNFAELLIVTSDVNHSRQTVGCHVEVDVFVFT